MASALLASEENKEERDRPWGCSPLIRAAEMGHLAVVDILLAAGADVEARSEMLYYTALEAVAQHGHTRVVKAILGHGADVNAMGELLRLTALYRAAVRDQTGAIDVLIEAGAGIEAKSLAEGFTPLCFAAHHLWCGGIRALLRHGANADIRDNRGKTLLHLAICRRMKGIDTVVDLLLQSGLDETALDSDGKTPVALALEPGTGYFGRRHSCSSEELERAKLLLDRAPNNRAWRRRCWL